MNVIDYPSPNFSERVNGLTPEMIIIHWAGGHDPVYSLNLMLDPKEEVSCHYFLDEEGKIYKLVDENKNAWHAGVSMWNGENSINSRSIGIELSNHDGKPYRNKQITALKELCKDIMQRRDIPANLVLGHSDIAPNRRKDPHEHFPWKEMAQSGIGIWYKVIIKDTFNAAAVARKPKQLRELFKKVGYPVDCFKNNINPTLTELVSSFQRHFEPEVFKNNHAGTATKHTVAKLNALIRQNGY